ncbi:MAG: hypothetical protein IGR92_01385 [Leptolyngbyaceae cyanobacterium T60_A2020_046]|nr:hypothetical protein [Leptolyngbyaceae cyanobacterium T60_A2020_046]
MSLPFILEIAIGLIFIYLILSLLASEIQEVIGTLLQWRAEHLKRSIEVLLAGNDRDSKEAAQALADRIYVTPLIRSLNQEATGPIGRSFRLISHAIGTVYHAVTRTRNIFGQSTSGPSYIPSEVFADTLLHDLQLESVRQVVVDTRLRRFIEERLLLPINHIVNDLRASTANEFLLNAELRQLEQSIGQIVQDFQEHRTTLADTLDRLLDRLEEFAQMAQDVLPDNHHLTETFMRRLQYLRRGLSNSDFDRNALLQKLRPNLTELVTILDDGSAMYREFKAIAAKEGGISQAMFERLQPKYVPPSLRMSLTSLSEKVKTQVSEVENDLVHLRQEVETWFNNGMERATGVYRRNAKAVAILIGIAIAVSLNADSLHILDRLATDPAIRSAITQAAESYTAANPDATLAELQTDLEETLDTLPIPIGRRPMVLEQQQAAEDNWHVPLIPRRWIGWIITGFAISMGSNFWFNLLRKVVNVKTSGQAPKSS